jgi:hypothetical protein
VVGAQEPYSIRLSDSIGRQLHVYSIMASLASNKVTALTFYEQGADQNYWQYEDMKEKLTLDVFALRKVI